MSDGYSGTPLAKKLGIDDESVFTVLHAPPGSPPRSATSATAVWQRNLMPPIDVVVAFFTERAKLAAEWPTLTDAAAPAGAGWVAWPKKTSGVRSDLTEDVLRATCLRTGWVDNKVCAIDATWSGLRFVLRKENRRPGDKRR